MPLFAYRARDQKGILVTGKLESMAAEPIKKILSEQGLIPISVKAIQAKVDWLPEPKFLRKVQTREILAMTRQFYTLFKAGMSMETLLGILARQTKNKTLNETLNRIQTEVSQGSTLAKAFAQHPKIFDDLYVNMLSAGEEAGILEEVLKNLSTLIEKEMEISASVKSATLYPKLVVGVLFVAMTVMLIWVVPEFAKFYANYKATLPLPTRMLTAASQIVRAYSWIVVLLVGGIYLLVRRYYHTPAGKLKLDGVRWAIPIFGPLSQKISNARFAHLLSSLYQSGFSITKGLALIENILDNELMVRDIRNVRAEIERGMSLSEAMRKTKCFSPMLVEATAIGEKTGSLDEMLRELGTHYDGEINHTVKNLTTLLEPFLLFFIFGMVGFFALSIFLPIWNISQAVLH